MKILLLGSTGQLGWELQRSLAPLGDLVALGRARADLANLAGLRSSLTTFSPDVIVNAAAYTAVDRAEADATTAMVINAEAPRVLAEWTCDANALLVHYSTDYVFDGAKAGAYLEADTPRPLNVYGHTKLAGERAIQASGCKYLILRTSWLYGLHGGNFAHTILKLARQRDHLRVVDDQIGAPTSVELLADVTALCLSWMKGSGRHSDALCGLYHVAAAGATTWHGFALLLVQTARELGMHLKVTPEDVKPVSSADYASPTVRPANSRLDTEKLARTFGVHMPKWEQHARRFVAEVANADHRAEA